MTMYCFHSLWNKSNISELTYIYIYVYGLNLVPDQSQATTRVPNDSLVYCVGSFLTISLYIERFYVPTLCVFLPADYV